MRKTVLFLSLLILLILGLQAMSVAQGLPGQYRGPGNGGPGGAGDTPDLPGGNDGQPPAPPDDGGGNGGGGDVTPPPEPPAPADPPVPLLELPQPTTKSAISAETKKGRKCAPRAEKEKQFMAIPLNTG